MNIRKKKESATLLGDFYCNRCGQYHRENERYEKTKHCVNCQEKIVEANSNSAESVIAAASRATLRRREVKRRTDDLGYEKELEKLNHGFSWDD